MNKPLGKLIVYNGGPQEYLINQEVKPFVQEKVINDILNSYPQGVIADYIRKIIIIPLICMFVFDAAVLFGYYSIETSKLQMMMGVMLGTIFKIVSFILYQKYLSNE